MITLLLLVRATYTYCCSSRTSRSWWIAHSTQRQPRGCNNIPSFYNDPHRSHVLFGKAEPGTTFTSGHRPILSRSEIPSGMYAKLRTVAASNNRDHPTRSLYYCLFAPHTYIFVLRAHPVRGESHNLRNTTGEVATLAVFFIRRKISRVVWHNRYLALGNGLNKFGNHWSSSMFAKWWLWHALLKSSLP